MICRAVRLSFGLTPFHWWNRLIKTTVNLGWQIPLLPSLGLLALKSLYGLSAQGPWCCSRGQGPGRRWWLMIQCQPIALLPSPYLLLFVTSYPWLCKKRQTNILIEEAGVKWYRRIFLNNLFCSFRQPWDGSSFVFYQWKREHCLFLFQNRVGY